MENKDQIKTKWLLTNVCNQRRPCKMRVVLNEFGKFIINYSLPIFVLFVVVVIASFFHLYYLFFFFWSIIGCVPHRACIFMQTMFFICLFQNHCDEYKWLALMYKILLRQVCIYIEIWFRQYIIIYIDL